MMTPYYVMVMDAWSNVTFTGPFSTYDEAQVYKSALNRVFAAHIVTEADMNENIRVLGPVPVQSPMES